MKNKDRYFKAMVQDDGKLNELDLGENNGFNEWETQEIIVQLLFENKIEYKKNGACNYSCIKNSKKKTLKNKYQ